MMRRFRLAPTCLAITIGLATVPALAENPMPPAEAAKQMGLPEGFTVTVYAAEPDVRQPIAFTIDPRGRLWVAENYSYPNWRTRPEGKDRILIFEDVDGDGKFDTRKVFWDKGANLTGLALGFGGVWACETPNLVFIPDRDGDDVPDGEAEVVLDGWDVKGQHNLFNALTWSPDGWLMGCNGIMSNSRVGRPGTPDADRTAINCGVWRYHPTRKVFEAVAHGSTNPWGLDFDDHGQAFFTNCVIPHAYRVIPGARFIRMYGQDFNPFTYAQMGPTADHIHWAGGSWTDSRGGQGKHGEAGGGHAHVGAMVYLGDNWPERYRDSLFTCNLHGRRVNNDALARQGSGYVATHRPDFLQAADPWFRGMELKYGPDGSVYMTDWSDVGECHDTDADGPHRENGRIFRIAYGKPKHVEVDLARLDNLALARLQDHPNDWHVRVARRLLQERAAAGQDMTGVHRLLGEGLRSDRDVSHRLRDLWTLHATGGIGPEALAKLLGHPEEWLRAWAVRLLVEPKTPEPSTLARFAELAASDPSPLVRLELASALQRIPTTARWPIAEGLLGHAEDAADASIPLMTWYGVEPLVPLDRARAVELAARSKIPLVRTFIARRVVAADDQLGGGAGVGAIVAAVARSDDAGFQVAMLDGLREAFRGRKAVPIPEGWPAAFDRLEAATSAEVRDRAVRLALELRDPRAVASLFRRLDDSTLTAADRAEVIRALAERQVPGLPARLLGRLDKNDEPRGPALRALSGYDDPSIPPGILRHYRAYTTAERGDAIATLATRPRAALALLEAVGSGLVPRGDLTATTARQLLALNDPKVAEALERQWGLIQPTSADKAAAIRRYKAMLPAEVLKGADKANGRSLFEKSCGACHKLYGQGGDVGPELTGSDRSNLDYILENVLDPSGSVPREYRLTTLAMRDGRVLAGMLQDSSEKTVVLRTINERLVLAREDVEEVRASNLSMMPEGLFEKLGEAEVRDLVAYLASKSRVP